MKPLQVLLVEDSEDDALLLMHELQNGGFKPEIKRVYSADTFTASLQSQQWNVVISDFIIPGFSGLEALKIIKKKNIDIPFIIVSGRIGEDTAVDAMKAGAHDYIMKGNLKRLVPAINRELKDAAVRCARYREEKAKLEAERKLRVANEELELRIRKRTKELEEVNKNLRAEIVERKTVEGQLRKLSRAVEQSPSSVVITDKCGTIEYVNPKFLELTGYAADEAIGNNPRILKSGKMAQSTYKNLWETITAGKVWRGEFQNKKKNGELYWELASISPVKDEHGTVTHFVGVKEDITKRKQIEEEREKLAHTLATERDILFTIMENTQTHLAYFDTDFNFINVNSTYAKGAGYGKKELLGKNHFDLFPNEENEKIFRKVRESGIAIEFKEKPFVHPDNPERGITYWDWTLIPVKNDSGHVIGLVLSLMDVTERKQLIEQLEVEQAKLNAIITNTPQGIIVADRNGKVILTNPSAKKLYTKPRETEPEQLDLSSIQLYHTDGVPYRSTDLPLNRSAKKGEVCSNVEVALIWADGQRRDLLVNTAPIRDNQGNITGAVMAFTDITDRRKAKEALQKAHDELEIRVQERTRELAESNDALRKSEKRFRSLVNSMEDTVFTLDCQNRFVEIYGNLFEKIGLKSKSVIGKSIYGIFNTRLAAIHGEANQRVLSGEYIAYEWHVPISSQRKLYFQSSLSPIYNSTGEIEGIVGIGRDITIQKLFEKQLIQAEKLMSVGEMSAMISHEFRNALTSVRMIMELHLESERLKSSEKKSLEIALASINHMDNIVGQLLSFASPTPLSFDYYNINKIITDSLDIIKLHLNTKYIQITTSLQEDLPAIKIDEKHFKEALINILLNSVYAISDKDGAPKQGTIALKSSRYVLKQTLRDLHYSDINNQFSRNGLLIKREPELILHQGTECILIEISDTGSGINSEHIHRIFDPFFTTKTKGTGLGLSMVKRTVNAHSGIIRVISKPGKGANFRIFLPILDNEE